MENQYLQIAGLAMHVDASLPLPENYLPFKKHDASSSPVCTVRIGNLCVSPASPEEKSTLDEAEELTVSNASDGTHFVQVQVMRTGAIYALQASSDWSHAILSAGCLRPECPVTVIDKLLMLSFIYAAAMHQVILLHASCIRIGDDGVAFIGHSGVGKSTHSRLWLSDIPGSSLLNDDQPAVKLETDGTVRLYGTPWSGKTPCYKSEAANLRGIFRMVQAPHNQVRPLSPVDLFRELLSSCSMMKSDPGTFRRIISVLAKVSTLVPGFILENRPEPEAAFLAYFQVFR